MAHIFTFACIFLSRMYFSLFAHVCFFLKHGSHPIVDRIFSTTGSFAIECFELSFFSIDLFSLKLFKLVRHIVVDYFLLCITWCRILLIIISKSTRLGHRTFIRLRNQQTKRNCMPMLLHTDWCYIHSSPKIRAECTWQDSHTSFLCNLHVAHHKHKAVATWITRCFHLTCEHF